MDWFYQGGVVVFEGGVFRTYSERDGLARNLLMPLLSVIADRFGSALSVD